MNEDKTKLCQWPRCKLESDIIYLGVGLCDKHWEATCKMPMEEAHKKFDIKQDLKEDV